MSETFLSLIVEYSYLILFVWAIFEGEVALVASGVLSHMGEMNFLLALLAGMLGGMTGDIFWYSTGRFNKQYAIKILRSHRREVALARIQVYRYGAYIVFIQRFIYGARLVVPLLIGASRYNFKRFLIINFFSSALWSLLYLTIAYFLGDSILQVFHYLKDHFYLVLLLIGLLITLAILYLKRYSKKNP